ncbi:MAG: hypothetical protein ACLFST_14690 [Spirochaetia bacterium]
MRTYPQPRDYKPGMILPADASSPFSMEGFLPVNIVNDYGFGAEDDRTHDNDAGGKSMWLGTCEAGCKPYVQFQFPVPVPLGTMEVWNYNQKEKTQNGIREAAVLYSVDCRHWYTLGGADHTCVFAKAHGRTGLYPTNLAEPAGKPVEFAGITAKYVRICPLPDISRGNWGGVNEKGGMLFGLSEVRFYVGEGYVVFPDEEWTRLFQRYEGWTGADGIFSIPFSGNEQPSAEKDGENHTLFLFSDTFVGTVDPETYNRTCSMLNNTIAVLKGNQPDKRNINFQYRINSSGKPGTVFDPLGEDHFSLNYNHYYWLQDGIIRNNTLYLTALNVYHAPEKPEGMRFRIGTVSFITAPLNSRPPYVDDYNINDDVPLAYDYPDGSRGFVGCGILPNTEDAGSPGPDGFIYLYGYKNKSGHSHMIAGRVKEDVFPDITMIEYFADGEWSRDIGAAEIIAEDVSHELSVSPIYTGPDKGKYILVYQKEIAGHLTSYRIGETPYGPFSEAADFYHTDEWLSGSGITTYNAKAHPHLSKPGELLISYNVNTTSDAAHLRNGDIYRPRFIVAKRLWR